MFCPKCRAEFVEGVKVCSDCGVPLVRELPKEEALEYQELVEVFLAWKISEANFVKSLLESNSIRCFIRNMYYPSMFPVGSAAVPIKIVVAEEDKVRAGDIINQYFKDQERE